MPPPTTMPEACGNPIYIQGLGEQWIIRFHLTVFAATLGFRCF
jgi:hypothetical protein